MKIHRALSLIDASDAPVLRQTIVPNQIKDVAHSPYRPGYDWLFVSDRKLFRLLSPWLKAHRFDLIGDKGILTEALANAFCHGHDKNPDLPITILVYVGRKGLMVQIKDRGKGFDVPSFYRDYKAQKKYWVFAGNGLKNMIDSTQFIIFYNMTGTIFHLTYLFNDF